MDEGDRDAWLAEAGSANGFAGAYLLGDATLDGIVDAADLNRLGTNWLTENSAWCSGNFNAQAVVDAGDLNLVGVHWQQAVAAASDSAAAIPEPSSARLLLTIVVCCSIAERRLRIAERSRN